MPDPDEEYDGVDGDGEGSEGFDDRSSSPDGGGQQARNPSGPKARDPYENDDTTGLVTNSILFC